MILNVKGFMNKAFVLVLQKPRVRVDLSLYAVCFQHHIGATSRLEKQTSSSHSYPCFIVSFCAVFLTGGVCKWEVGGS